MRMQRNSTNMKMMKKIISTLLSLPASFVFAHASEPTLAIEGDQSTGKASPMLYGLITEEINHCYDGGLYAELVRNRAFQDEGKNPAHWWVVQGANAVATIALDRTQP